MTDGRAVTEDAEMVEAIAVALDWHTEPESLSVTTIKDVLSGVAAAGYVIVRPEALDRLREQNDGLHQAVLMGSKEQDRLRAGIYDAMRTLNDTGEKNHSRRINDADDVLRSLLGEPTPEPRRRKYDHDPACGAQCSEPCTCVPPWPKLRAEPTPKEERP